MARSTTAHGRRYRAVAAQLADICFIGAGSITRRPNRCGKPNCRCHADPLKRKLRR